MRRKRVETGWTPLPLKTQTQARLPPESVVYVKLRTSDITSVTKKYNLPFPVTHVCWCLGNTLD